MATKALLHQLIDELPDDAVDQAAHYLAQWAADPLLRSLLTAPGDEPAWRRPTVAALSALLGLPGALPGGALISDATFLATKFRAWA